MANKNEGSLREGVAQFNLGEAVRRTNRELLCKAKRERYEIIRDLKLSEKDTVTLIDGTDTLVCNIGKDGMVELYTKGKVEPSWLRDNLASVKKLRS